MNDSLGPRVCPAPLVPLFSHPLVFIVFLWWLVLLLLPGLASYTTSFHHHLLISLLRTSLSTSMLQVCLISVGTPNCLMSWKGEHFPVLQAPCSCSCRTPRGSILAGRRGAAGTPPPPTARDRLAARRGWATTGLTTPCWPKPGGRGCWAMNGWLTACSGTWPTSVLTRTTDYKSSGTAARRKWMPAPPNGHLCYFYSSCYMLSPV